MARENYCAFLGRMLLALTFLAAAFGKITNFNETVGVMSSYGIPWPVFLCAMSALIEMLGGVSLALGYYTSWGAAILAAFLIPVTLVFHLAPDQRTHLIKNLSIIGGLLMVIAFGPGEISLDKQGQLR